MGILGLGLGLELKALPTCCESISCERGSFGNRQRLLDLPMCYGKFIFVSQKKKKKRVRS